MDTPGELRIKVDIFMRAVEVEVAGPFESNTTDASCDADATHRFWQALVQADRVLTAFRARYLGKSSPVHLFWGSFDLAYPTTRCRSFCRVPAKRQPKLATGIAPYWRPAKA